MVENSSIRVGVISHSSGLRGAERALLEAIEALHDHPVSLHVFVPAEGLLSEQLRIMGVGYSLYSAIPWVSTRHSWWRSLGKLLFACPKIMYLALQLRKHKCHLVYSNTMAISMGAWAAALLRIPHIWHIHEFVDDDHQFQYDLGEYYAKWVYRNIGHFFIINSYAVARKMTEFVGSALLPSHYTVIYQSVTLPSIPSVNFDKPVSNSITLVLVGALHKNKGQNEAIRAILELKDRGIETKLLLVGDGDYKHYLLDLVDDLGLQRNIQFVGFVKNVSAWYAQANLVLVCSRNEAFGRVAVEGMLSGKPLVVAKSGGLQEIVEDGVTGVYYEPGNIAELADKISFLLINEDYAKLIAQQGLTRAKSDFTKVRYGQELYDTLASVIERK